MRETEVVVVGAGLAGLAAARNLDRDGIETEVLEARDRVGGRVESHELSSGSAIDLGAQWISPDQDHIQELLEDYDIDTFDQYTEGVDRFRVGGTVYEHDEDGVYGLPDEAQDELLEAIDELDRCAEDVPLDAPQAAPRAEKWDSITVETWKNRVIDDERAREAFNAMIRAWYTSEPAELSFLFVLWHSKAGGGFMNLQDTQEGALAEVVRGAQRLPQAMANELGDRVHLNSPVRSVEHDSTGVVVHTDGEPVTAEYVIVAVNPMVAGRIRYEPELPARREELMQRMPNGSVLKAVVAYETPFWRADGVSGEVLDNDSPLTAVVDATPPDADVGLIVGFVCGQYSRALHEQEEEERRETVVSELGTVLDNERATDPVDYVDKLWSTSRWSAGCFNGHAPAGTMQDHWETLDEPAGRIHWAGAETAAEWPGHMDGAVRSGRREALKVLDRLA